VAAVLLARLQKRWGAADTFIRISEKFETAQARANRRAVYDLHRADYDEWTDDERAATEAWCAHLDLVAVLYRANQINRQSLFLMYGDVILRTTYQIAPYWVSQATTRGPQFLLPLRQMMPDLLKRWRLGVRVGDYPDVIGFPRQPTVRLDAGLFEFDHYLHHFAPSSRRALAKVPKIIGP
jgi:hypothetical protein